MLFDLFAPPIQMVLTGGWCKWHSILLACLGNIGLPRGTKRSGITFNGEGHRVEPTSLGSESGDTDTPDWRCFLNYNIGKKTTQSESIGDFNGFQRSNSLNKRKWIDAYIDVFKWIGAWPGGKASRPESGISRCSGVVAHCPNVQIQSSHTRADKLDYPPVSSNMASWKPWTIEISDVPSELNSN